MSYDKLFELLTIGLKPASFGALQERLRALGYKSLISHDEIQKSIRQKKLIDTVVKFMLDNQIIEEVDDYDEIYYRINIDFPMSPLEKEAKEFTDKKLFFSQKELLVNKIKYYNRKQEVAWIVFLDLANSTDKFGGDLTQKENIINKAFPELIKKTVNPYFSRTLGYLISQKGDEAHLFFFEKDDCLKFIDEFMSAYKATLFEIIEKYNKTRKIENPFADKMYLKIFLANSDVAEPNYDLYNMPNFNNMTAFTFIARAEKEFKKAMIDAGQTDIDSHFIVSQTKLDGFKELDLVTQDGNQHVFYQIN